MVRVADHAVAGEHVRCKLEARPVLVDRRIGHPVGQPHGLGAAGGPKDITQGQAPLRITVLRAQHVAIQLAFENVTGIGRAQAAQTQQAAEYRILVVTLQVDLQPAAVTPQGLRE